MDILHVRAIILFVGAFLDAVLLLFLWLRTKSKPAFHFGWSVLFSIFYCFTYGARFVFGNNRIFWARANWIGMLIIPGFIAFSYSLYKEKKNFKLKVFLWYLIGSIIFIVSIATPYIVKEIENTYPFTDTPGSLEPLTRIYLLIGLIIGWFNLLRYYFKAKEKEKLQLKYFIFGIGIHSLGALITAGIIPLIYPRFNYVDLSAVLTVPGVFLVTYAFVKRELFEIRVILTEILIALIGIILLIQGLLSETFEDRVLGLVIFASFLLIGYLLVKITQGEIKRKIEAERLAKELRDLNKTLEQRVGKRTKELQKSYDEIKERSEELERFYKLTIGREMKILELKKRIKELTKK